MRHLVAIAGPIGAGKSTVAELVARRAWATGMTAALADLDDVAFAQRANVDLTEFWRRAGTAHSALVRGWFDAGVDVVIAHGPFFESDGYDSLFGAAPVDARRHHVLLRATVDVALERVAADPQRGPGALSAQPDFLRATHAAFVERVGSLPKVDMEIDTSKLAPAAVADRVSTLLQAR